MDAAQRQGSGPSEVTSACQGHLSRSHAAAQAGRGVRWG